MSGCAGCPCSPCERSSRDGTPRSRTGTPAACRRSRPAWPPRTPGVLPLLCRQFRRVAPRSRSSLEALSEPHAVRVAVLVVALVGVAVPCGDARLAHDDHAGRTPVDAQAAPGADVLVDDEDHVVVGVDAGLVG